MVIAILFYVLDTCHLKRFQILKEQNLFNEMTKPTIYEADGCYFHGCEHMILERFKDLKTTTDDSTKETIADQLRVLLQRRYDTQQKREVLEESGDHVHTITECRWRDKLKTISFNGIKGVDKIKPYLVRKFGTRPEAVTDEIILEELRKPLSPIDGDGLFGFVRCDIGSGYRKRKMGRAGADFYQQYNNRKRYYRLSTFTTD